MNILMISVFEGLIPPPRYGGVERLVAWQIWELQRRGHHVTLICREGSTMPCEKITYQPQNLKQVVRDYLEQEGHKFDFVHEHGQSYLADNIKNYLWSNSDSGSLLFAKYKNKVHHTQAQTLAEGLPPFAYAHIGQPMEDILYSDVKEDYLVWTSCISYRHGADIAVEVALPNKIRLIFVNDLNLNRDGYEQFVKPYLGPYIEFFDLSPLPVALAALKKEQIVAHAKALIAPARDTTFGIVLIEAMAAGTPAIAAISDDPICLPAGEIIEHGVTGYVCRTNSDYDTAVKSLHLLQPQACLDRCQRMFTVEKMMDKYEELYERIRWGERW